MSECVVRMEMPRNCLECPLRNQCELYCDWLAVFGTSAKRKPYPKPLNKGCHMLAVIPEVHGRLVDAELVKKILKPVDSISHYEPEWTWGELYESNCVAIDNVPTVVPATERE